jgi:aspartate racemase
MERVMSRETVVGVLGGMGVRATWAFLGALTNAIPFEKEWEHPRVIMDCNTKIPSRTRCLLYGEESPVQGMIDSVNGLARMARPSPLIVAVPCNQAHYWRDEVLAEAEVWWADMILLVSAEVADRGIQRPVVLGGHVTKEKRLYDRYLSPSLYLLASEEIEARKQGLGDGCVDDLVTALLREGAEGVILACTELTATPRREVVDSLQVYAKKIAEMV